MEQKRLEEWQRRETAAATATAAMTAMSKHSGKVGGAACRFLPKTLLCCLSFFLQNIIQYILIET